MTRLCRHLTRVLAGFLAVNATMAAAQPSEAPPLIRAGIEEAIRALDHSPRFKTMSPQTKKRLVEFTVGNIMFVMAHEMGHVVISELGFPVLGKEEDAADAFAVLVALHMRHAFSQRVLIEAAKGWHLSDYRDRKQGHALAFYDEHGLDLQRAYSVVCLMVGSDPDKFKALAAEARLPQERQASCVRDYKNAIWSWDLLLKPHRRSAGQPKVAIDVTYRDEEKYAVQLRVLRHMRLLEAFAEHAANAFSWPKPFSMEARACGEPNATWAAGTRTLTLCYELAEEFIRLFQDYSRKLPGKFRSAR